MSLAARMSDPLTLKNPFESTAGRKRCVSMPSPLAPFVGNRFSCARASPARGPSRANATAKQDTTCCVSDIFPIDGTLGPQGVWPMVRRVLNTKSLDAHARRAPARRTLPSDKRECQRGFGISSPAGASQTLHLHDLSLLRSSFQGGPLVSLSLESTLALRRVVRGAFSRDARRKSGGSTHAGGRLERRTAHRTVEHR